MKLWEKGINPEPAIIEFTAGKDRKTDLALTKWDIIGSMAHVIMLQDVGLISDGEKNDLLKALHSLFVIDNQGHLVIEKDMEDIHSQIEKEMSSILGRPVRKFIPAVHEMTRCWLTSACTQGRRLTVCLS